MEFGWSVEHYEFGDVVATGEIDFAFEGKIEADVDASRILVVKFNSDGVGSVDKSGRGDGIFKIGALTGSAGSGEGVESGIGREGGGADDFDAVDVNCGSIIVA